MSKQTEELISIQEDYAENFVPAVHRIGRLTMLPALFLMILPPLYLMFVEGYLYDSIQPYIGWLLYSWPTSMSLFISEPIQNWVFMGSAGIYMSYLSGNCMGLRAPVAISAQNQFDAPVDTPKGQIVSTICVAISVVTNLIAILLIILLGNQLLRILPPVVQASFQFITVCFYGSMFVMRLSANKSGKMSEGFQSLWPYLLGGAGVYYVSNWLNLPTIVGPFLSLGLCGLIAYLRFKAEVRNSDNHDI